MKFKMPEHFIRLPENHLIEALGLDDGTLVILCHKNINDRIVGKAIDSVITKNRKLESGPPVKGIHVVYGLPPEHGSEPIANIDLSPKQLLDLSSELYVWGAVCDKEFKKIMLGLKLEERLDQRKKRLQERKNQLVEEKRLAIKEMVNRIPSEKLREAARLLRPLMFPIGIKNVRC